MMKKQRAFLRIAAVVFVFVFACCIVMAQLAPGGGSAALQLPQKSNGKAALAVADTLNNRVLIYKAPIRTDERASLVLGQPNFVQDSPNRGAGSPAANTLSAPYGVAQGPDSEFFVADTANCRVLEYVPPFSNGMNASVVIGEPDFETHNCFTLTTATASSLAAPVAVALDSHGDLWVVDSSLGDSRVLEYVPPFSNGMAASLMIGQTTTGASQGCNQVNGQPTRFGGAAIASGLCVPRDLSFDSSGDLWIADLANNRVLEFVPPFSTGMSASLELGQPAGPDQFITQSPNQCLYTLPNCGPTAGKLFFPTATAFDAGGNLWVADSGNNRVLEYEPPFSNGMNASLVLGQPDFTSGGTGVVTGYLDTPEGLAFQQSSGNLFVSDSNLNRVLMFEPPFTINMSPDAILGQRNLNGGLPNQGSPTPTAKTLYFPTGLAALQ